MATGPSNPVVHLELHTPDVAGACAFYSRLCGWEPERIDPGYERYRQVDVGEELGGSVVQCSSGRPLWLPYVRVESVPRATARAGELGAAVLLEPREGPAGWRSVVASPAGGELAFWQPKR
jgi:predicted enzyme related to lactoylglutathione lyase